MASYMPGYLESLTPERRQQLTASAFPRFRGAPSAAPVTPTDASGRVILGGAKPTNPGEGATLSPNGAFWTLPDGRQFIAGSKQARFGATDDMGNPYGYQGEEFQRVGGQPNWYARAGAENKDGEVTTVGGMPGMSYAPRSLQEFYEKPQDDSLGSFMKDTFGAFLQGPAIPLSGFAAAGGLSGLGATGAGGGVTADSIAAGIAGGENAAGAMYSGLGAGVGGAAEIASGDFGQWGATLENAGGEALGGLPGTVGAAGTELQSLLGPLTQKIGEQAAKSLLGKILNGTATSDDWASLIGKLGPGILGIIGSNAQGDAYQRLAERYEGYGAPSRARFEGSFNPGFSMASEPGYKDALDQTTKSFLHKASIAGNPADSPNAWGQTLKDVNSTFAYPALTEYRRMNASAGGLPASSQATFGAETGGIEADRNYFNSIGSMAGNVFDPPKTAAEQMSEFSHAMQEYQRLAGKI